MSSNDLGTINWRDLTVENAEEIRDFYSNVVGWQLPGGLPVQLLGRQPVGKTSKRRQHANERVDPGTTELCGRQAMGRRHAELLRSLPVFSNHNIMRYLLQLLLSLA